MGLDDAYAKAVECMSRIDPRRVSYASGVEFDNNRFIIPLFHLTYTVKLPKCDIAEMGTCAVVPKVLAILLMHYLTNADGSAITGSWINYRQLPGAKLFERRFTNLVSQPLLDLFRSDIESFREAAVGFGGQPMNGMGDAAFVFKALPRLPVACVLNIGDGEMPPSMNILFDQAAPNYLPTEDVTILCGVMLSLLRNLTKTGFRKMN